MAKISTTILILFVGTGFATAPAQEKIHKPPAEPNDFVTKIYHVPPSFLSTDPNNKAKAKARLVLEKAGVKFPPGASARYNTPTNTLIVKNTRDQLTLVGYYLAGSDDLDSLKQLFVILESIEADRELFQNWMFKNRILGKGNQLRKEIQEWIKKGQGKIVETTIINTRSGNRSKAESAAEFIYPMEMDPPEIPTEVDLDGPTTKSPRSGGNPTAFGVRNLGSTLEVDARIRPDDLTIDLALASKIVRQNGYTHWPGGDPFYTISQPKFQTMNITTEVTVTSGNYALIGSHRTLEATDPKQKPTVMIQFIRADVQN